MVRFSLIVSLISLFVSACGSDEPERNDGPKKVSKTNSARIYMHYMPWYQSKDVSGYWGSHWRMANKNPEVIDANGKREIASHYYPLIGPYDSKDPDVLEYHLLLMKYAGVDVVLLDWYGSHNVNDYRPILTASNALIAKLDEMDLQFAIVYEEYTAEAVANQTGMTAIAAAQEDVAYMEGNYFNNTAYAQINSKPLLLTFGPRYFKEASQWTSIFGGLELKPVFLPLWDHSSLVGASGTGEYSWIDFNSDLSQLNSFYNKTTYLDVLIGSAYPRFHDFYQQGGWGQSYGYVDDLDGQTLAKTLAIATDRKAEHVQLVTWNDFGEGTVIEPTLEDGFTFLQTIQQFTGVSYDLDELELIHTYYDKKKAFQHDAAANEKLLEAYQHLLELDPGAAEKVLETLQ